MNHVSWPSPILPIHTSRILLQDKESDPTNDIGGYSMYNLPRFVPCLAYLAKQDMKLILALSGFSFFGSRGSP